MVTGITILEQHEVKVSHLQRFERIQKSMPKILKEFHDKIKDLKNEDLENEYLYLRGSETFYPQVTNYYLKVVNLFTSEPLTDEMVGLEQLENLYFTCLSYLQVGKGEEMESFTFNDVEYFLPKPAMVGEEIGTFLKVQSYAKDPINNMHHIISHLCRPEGEDYNIEVNLNRAESFRQLSLQTALNVSFFLQKLLVLYRKRLKNSMNQEVLKRITRLQKDS